MSIHSYVRKDVAVDEVGQSCVREERLRTLKSHVVDHATATRLADTFRALSDPTRIRIVSALSSSELCVCELAAALGMSQSAVSHQLRTLRDLRLVRRRRQGRQIFYALDDDHVADLFQRGLEHIAHG
jgi:ArsR family transcriptional regulator